MRTAVLTALTAALLTALPAAALAAPLAPVCTSAPGARAVPAVVVCVVVQVNGDRVPPVRAP